MYYVPRGGVPKSGKKRVTRIKLEPADLRTKKDRGEPERERGNSRDEKIVAPQRKRETMHRKRAGWSGSNGAEERLTDGELKTSGCPATGGRNSVLIRTLDKREIEGGGRLENESEPAHREGVQRKNSADGAGEATGKKTERSGRRRSDSDPGEKA